MPSLMDKASAGAPAGKPFQPADISKAVPPQAKDAVDRVVAAGMKIMYSPEMKDERMQAVQSPDPIPKKLSDNILGLMLTLDQQTKGGIPVEALFPAAMMLMTEAAQILTHAGQAVSDEDYKDAARMLFVGIGKKLGGTDQQIMDAAKQALPGGGGADGAPPDDGSGMPDDPAADPAATPPDQPMQPAAGPGGPPPSGTPPLPGDDQLPDEDQVQ